MRCINIFLIRLFNYLFRRNNPLYFRVDFHNTFGFKRKLDLKNPIDVFIDIIPSSTNKYNRVLVLLEPNEISGLRKDVLNLSQNYFDLILTHDPIILKHFSNAKKFVFGTSWIKDYKFNKKLFGVSTLIGGKTITPLHRLRHQLIDLLELDFNVNLFFFNSINENFSSSDSRLLKMQSKNSKNELFLWQFHIVIENVISENWFTEKIIDCFQSKTVPIYLGCPNIGDYFNLNGIIVVKDYLDIINVLKNINFDTYVSMQEFVNINYEQSKQYIDFGARLESEVILFDSLL
ncbi:glycosyltransferase family 10 domain-containing protein [Aquirufa sp. A-Brett2-W8]|jgi:hypothetical protein